MRHFIIIAMVALASAFGAPAQAQDADELRVITRQIAPFVMKDGDKWQGFSVELWQAIADEMNRKFRFVEKGNVKEILSGIKAGEGDVAISAISITAAREQDFDFSQPMFESGIQVMARSEQGGSVSWAQFLALITSPTMLAVLGVLALAILIPAHIAWFTERKRAHHLFPDTYFPGIFHAMYWATGAVSGQPPEPLHTGWGRLFAAVLIIGSLFFTSYFTATITTSLTLQQLKSDISSVADLMGKRVATTKGSTSEAFLRQAGAYVISTDKIEEAEQNLESRLVDAVMFDAPVLRYYATTKGQGRVRLVGELLKKENYGILFPQGSPLRKPVNEALLKLHETGAYDALYAKWFGSTAQ